MNHESSIKFWQYNAMYVYVYIYIHGVYISPVYLHYPREIISPSTSTSHTHPFQPHVVPPPLLWSPSSPTSSKARSHATIKMADIYIFFIMGLNHPEWCFLDYHDKVYRIWCLSIITTNGVYWILNGTIRLS